MIYRHNRFFCNFDTGRSVKAEGLENGGRAAANIHCRQAQQHVKGDFAALVGDQGSESHKLYSDNFASG